MDRARRNLATFAALWGVVGLVFAYYGLKPFHREDLLDPSVAFIVFPLLAFAAARFAWRGSRRVAGLLLVLSAGTATGFLYVLNVIVFAVGLTEVISGGTRRGSAGTARRDVRSKPAPEL